jgi:uncharacterized protein (DUF2235 family)
MKRLVICLDGTWNKVREPKRVTNVVRLAQAVKPSSEDRTAQVVYYNSGVGTGDIIDKVLGGVFGRGVQSNVKRAYAFLSLNFELGDEIYLFGFSRGAYTARALAGLVGASGILKQHRFADFEVAWNRYRTPPARRASRSRQEVDWFHEGVDVTCVGVWDTVGSYGVPAGFGLGALARYVTSWQSGFHDTHFGSHVRLGLHALAIDERRRPFSPTFWTIRRGSPMPANVEQVWFCGAHSNVGGGYEDGRVSDLPLAWMLARVVALTRLEIDREFVSRAVRRADPTGTVYMSNRIWPVSRVFPFRRPVFATAEEWERLRRANNWQPDEQPINERVHWSVKLRLATGGLLQTHEQPYEPRNLQHHTLAFTQPTKEEIEVLPGELMSRMAAIR